MAESTFTAPLATPFYTDHVLYHAIGGGGTPSLRAWQFSGWKAESMSWKTGCYIHAGLSRTGPLSMKGPDAAKFPVGSMKHAVMCNDVGLIGAHGIVATAVATKTTIVIGDLYETDHAYLVRFPNVKRFLKEVMARPAWKRTVEKTMPAGPPPM